MHINVESWSALRSCFRHYWSATPRTPPRAKILCISAWNSLSRVSARTDGLQQLFQREIESRPQASALAVIIDQRFSVTVVVRQKERGIDHGAAVNDIGLVTYFFDVVALLQ